MGASLRPAPATDDRSVAVYHPTMPLDPQMQMLLDQMAATGATHPSADCVCGGARMEDWVQVS